MHVIEARLKVPETLRQIALRAVSAMIKVDKNGLNDMELDHEIMALQGYANFLVKCLYCVRRDQILTEAAEREAAKELNPS